MGAVTFGPLVFDADRLAAYLGISAFFIVAWGLARFRGEDIARWSWHAVAIGAVAARLGHVVLHRQSFAEEPLRALAFWQGGFMIQAGFLAAALSTLLLRPSLRWWSVPPMAAGLLVWTVAIQLAATTDGRGLPNGDFATLDGASGPIGISSQPTVLNLWATWCPPCRREMPMMAEVAEARDDVRFIFANQGEDAESVRAFIEAEGLDLETILLDTLGEITRHYETPGLPATLFIAPDGSVRDLHLGEISRETLLEGITRLPGAQ